MTPKPFLNNYLRYDNKSIFCFVDFETEGLNLLSSRPWQMGIIMVRGDEIIERHNVYIYWEDLKVSAEAAKITGYNAERVKREGKTPEDALNFLELKIKEADFVVGHNIVGYDSYIYKAWCRWLKRAAIDLRDKLLDTFLFAKSIKLNIPFKPEVNRYAFFMKLYNEIVKRLGCSLGVLAKEYKCNVDDTKLHDALYDLELNVQIWNKMKWNIPV